VILGLPFWQKHQETRKTIMDRCDADQEGITLPPVHLSQLLAQQEAQRAIVQHLGLCGYNTERIADRVRCLEMGYARLTGFMVGAGILGGASSALISKLLGH
jgi:hypothetical protein